LQGLERVVQLRFAGAEFVTGFGAQTIEKAQAAPKPPGIEASKAGRKSTGALPVTKG
jgi:hypothetical protein